MSGFLLLIAFMAPVLAIGGVVLWRTPRDGRRAGWPPRANSRGTGYLQRGVRAHAALVAQLGSLPAAVVIVMAGFGMIVAIFWPIGAVIARVQEPIDYPSFSAMQNVLAEDPNGWLATLSSHLTKMGDLVPIFIVSVAASAAFALLWVRRGWWIPPLIIFATLFVELCLQRLLALVVNRGHPPTANGTYPSGGSARLLATGGVIVWFIVLTWPWLSPRVRALLWIVVALLAVLEGFTRIYLLQHYPSDVPSGWLFGLALLLTMLAATSALTSRDARTGEAAEASPASS